MRVCKGKSVVFKDGSYKFALALEYFVEHLLIIDVVRSLDPILLTDIVDHLCFGDGPKFLKFVDRVIDMGEDVLAAFLIFLLITWLDCF